MCIYYYNVRVSIQLFLNSKSDINISIYVFIFLYQCFYMNEWKFLPLHWHDSMMEKPIQLHPALQEYWDGQGKLVPLRQISKLKTHCMYVVGRL